MNTENKEILDERKGSSNKNSKKANSRGRRNSSRRPSSTEKPEVKSYRESTYNDPKWYAASEQLLKDAFSLSLPQSLGISNTYRMASKDSVAMNYEFTVPGICTLYVTPIPGISQYGSSPVNLAAFKLYSWVRHANSGSANYDAADLMMYILAMDNAYMLYSYLVRAYGVLRLYNQKNRYMPAALIKAMNLDFDSLVTNISDFRMLINQFASALASFAVPSSLPYVTRHNWLFSNYYSDAPDYKAQIYMYVPSKLFQWSEKTSSGELGKLTPVHIGMNRNPIQFDELKSLINDFLNPIITSEDFGIMSGDILKAYGLSKLITVPLINEDYTVLPSYVPEVLSQIENAEPIAESDMTAIKQTASGYIDYQPIGAVGWDNVSSEALLNFHSDIVTPADVAVATRLIAVMDYPHATMDQFKAPFFAAGSEICDLVGYHTLNKDGSLTTRKCNYSNLVAADSFSNHFELITTMSAFNQHPIHMVCEVLNGDPSAVKPLGWCCDFDNYTIVDGDKISNMHNVALLSLFDVPSIAGE